MHTSIAAKIVLLVMIGLMIGSVVKQISGLTKIPFAPIMLAVGIIT